MITIIKKWKDKIVPTPVDGVCGISGKLVAKTPKVESAGKRARASVEAKPNLDTSASPGATQGKNALRERRAVPSAVDMEDVYASFALNFTNIKEGRALKSPAKPSTQRPSEDLINDEDGDSLLTARSPATPPFSPLLGESMVDDLQNLTPSMSPCSPPRFYGDIEDLDIPIGPKTHPVSARSSLATSGATGRVCMPPSDSSSDEDVMIIDDDRDSVVNIPRKIGARTLSDSPGTTKSSALF